MFKQFIADESGLSTIEILVGMIVLVILAIISFYALRTGVHNASNNLGTKVNDFVDNSSVTDAGGGNSTVSLPFN